MVQGECGDREHIASARALACAAYAEYKTEQDVAAGKTTASATGKVATPATQPLPLLIGSGASNAATAAS